MESSPAVLNKPPPSFPAPPRSVDFSALEFILGLLANITVPALIYAFFFAIMCPPNLFRLHQSSIRPRRTSTASSRPIPKVMSDIKYWKDDHVKEIGTECSVCLSVFDDGEEVRQLCVCKHPFHRGCIDM